MKELNTIIRICFFITLCCGMLLVGVELEMRNHKCKELPVNNQLIKANDTLYYRIHVRVDTTYFVQAVADVDGIKVSHTKGLYYKRRSTSNTN